MGEEYPPKVLYWLNEKNRYVSRKEKERIYERCKRDFESAKREVKNLWGRRDGKARREKDKQSPTGEEPYQIPPKTNYTSSDLIQSPIEKTLKKLEQILKGERGFVM